MSPETVSSSDGRDVRRRRRAILYVSCLVVIVLVAVGAGWYASSATSGAAPGADAAPGAGSAPGAGGDSGSRGDSGNGGSNQDEEDYEFYLPEGDTGVSGQAHLMYGPLYEHECGRAQENLNTYGQQLTRRDRLLYQAAIELCFERRQSARNFYSQVPSDQWVFQENAVTKKDMQCLTYRAVRSVLDRQPQETIPCPVGIRPEWEE